MTNAPYIAPCSYFLIYVYEIPGSVDHAGILKVGDTSFKTLKNALELTPNCAELNAAARKRIDQQTGTAGVRYVLHHAELAVRTVRMGGEKVLSFFRDHDVHDVLEKSGCKHVKIDGTPGREWYRADLKTIRNAIAAVKEGRIALDSSELKKPESFIFKTPAAFEVVRSGNLSALALAKSANRMALHLRQIFLLCSQKLHDQLMVGC